VVVKMKKILLILILSMFLVGTISASQNKIWFGANESDISQMIPVLLTNTGILKTDMNFSVADIWNTNIGQLTDVNSTQFDNIGSSLNIDESWIDSLWCRLTGCEITGNLNVTGNVTASFFLGDTVTPESHFDLVNKEYVDDATSSTAFDFFFNNLSSDIANHFNMTESDLENPESSLTTSSFTSPQTIGIFNWTTLVGQPEFNELRQGVYDVHFHMEKLGNRDITITPKLYNISADGSTRDLIVIFETSNFLTTSGNEYDLHGVLGENIMLEDTIRLNLELEANVFGSPAGSPTTVTIELEGTTDSHLSIETSTNAFEKIFVRRDGTNELVGNWDAGNFNITADFYFGDGSQLTNLPAGSETDPFWTGNQTNYFNTSDILGFSYYNSTDFSISDYLTSAQILGFNYYNSTDFNINDYPTLAEILGFNYYNSTDFSISDYYLKNNPFGFYNVTTLPSSGLQNSTSWNRSGTDVFLANSGDKVGIGTTSPGQALTVVGNLALNGTRSKLFYRGDSDAHIGSLAFYSPDGGTTAIITPYDDVGAGITNSRISFGGFGNFDASNVSLTVSGNVGIGIGSPQFKLHTQVDGADNELRLETINSGSTKLRWQNTGNNAFEIVANRTAGQTELRNPFSNAMRFYTNDIERIVILGGGNVGINTTNPQSSLSVNGIGVSNAAVFASGLGAGNYPFAFDGNTGALTPSSIFGGYISYNQQGGGGGIDIIDAWDSAGRTRVFSIRKITGGVVGSPMFTILNNSNVGIGTATPLANLHINGTSAGIYFEGTGATVVDEKVWYFASESIGVGPFDGNFAFRTADDSGGYFSGETIFNVARIGTAVSIVSFPNGNFIVTDNVGIGTSLPAGALDVSGNISFTDTGTALTGNLNYVTRGGSDFVLQRASSNPMFKENIIDIPTSELDYLLQLEVKKYQRKDTGQWEIGLLSTEVELINPDWVVYDIIGGKIGTEFNETTNQTTDIFNKTIIPFSVNYQEIAIGTLALVQNQQVEMDLMKESLCKLGEVQYC